MSLTLKLHGYSSHLQQYYMPPIVLEGGGTWMIGLIEFNSYNTIPNIEKETNTIKVGNHVIEIPEGTYELDEINKYVNETLKSLLPQEPKNYLGEKSENRLINITGNLNTLKAELECVYDVDFTHPKSIAPLLGFSQTLLKAGKKHISQLPVNIIKNNDINVECSIASGSFDNDRPSHIIYAFFVDVEPGFKIAEKPSTIIYHPITNNVISCITIRILDQQGELINFRGEHISVRLHLKRL